ncbi:hypothetical protein MAPG_03800 [Magnaporthiopsis poae ATCC 64411]|uniref:Rhodopsin domain-containing protein n=1 Tax=Magnaporthiopsis poae (strain ATCC 64411 / 73-15) TaxID=644358 RepID=A0A0C4DV03_MAGP6|nr:hypothetical protein MAPG_03800 [Magnaporthiopsis poae ATCC 64411]
MTYSREVVPRFIAAALALNAVVVGLRLYVRLVISKAVGYDDWALLLAFISLVLYGTATWVGIAQGYGATDPSEIHDLVMATKCFSISGVLFFLTLCLTKISSASVLYRLATTHRFIQRLLQVTAGIILIWCAVGALLVGFQCWPLSIVWGETPVSEGSCLSPDTLSKLGLSVAAMDIASAFLFAIIPVFLLRNIQLPLSTKILVIILLGLGTLTSVITVLRLKVMIEMAALEQGVGTKAAGLYLQIYVYLVPELGLALFSAVIVALPPLVKLLLRGWPGPSGVSRRKGAPSTWGNAVPNIALHDMPGRSNESCAGSEESMICDGLGIKENSHVTGCSNV